MNLSLKNNAIILYMLHAAIYFREILISIIFTLRFTLLILLCLSYDSIIATDTVSKLCQLF